MKFIFLDWMPQKSRAHRHYSIIMATMTIVVTIKLSLMIISAIDMKYKNFWERGLSVRLLSVLIIKRMNLLQLRSFVIRKGSITRLVWNSTFLII